jgi:hypothetical protein
MAEVIIDKVGEFLKEWSEEVIDLLKERVPRASSELFQSISPVIQHTTDGTKLQLVMEDYWEDADLGVGKSADPINDWPIVKQGISDWIDAKPDLKAQINAEGGNYQSKKNSAVFLISRSIINHGTKNPPSFFFSEVLGDIPLNPMSARRREMVYPLGMGMWDELKDGLGELLQTAIIIELKE